MATAAVMNGNASSADWPGRCYHVDQILDRPGPRTDPSFLAGAEVRAVHPYNNRVVLNISCSGEGVSARQVQDPRHRRRRLGLRDPSESCIVRVQRHSCYRYGHHRYQQLEQAVPLQVRCVSLAWPSVYLI